MPTRVAVSAGLLLAVFAACLALHVREIRRTGLAQPPVYAVPGPAGDSYPRVGGLRLERGADWDGLEPGDRLLRLGDVDLRGVGHVGFDAIALEQAGRRLETTVTFERAGVRRTMPLRMRPYAVPWHRIPLALSWVALAVAALAAAPRSREAHLLFFTFTSFAICLTPILGGSRLQTVAHHVIFFGGWPIAIALGLLWMIRYPPELRPELRLPAAIAGIGVLHAVVRLGYLLGGPIPPAQVSVIAVVLDVLFLATGTVILTWNFVHANPVGRRRLKWVLYAMYLWIAVGLAGGAAPAVGRAVGGITFPSGMVATALAMVMLPLGIGVSVLRHNLFDVDRVILRTAAYSLTSLAAIGLALVVVPGMSAWLMRATQLDRGDAGLAVLAGLLGVGVPAARALEPVLERFFLRARLRTARDGAQLGRDLGECRTPEELLHLLASRLEEILRPETCRLFVAEGGSFAPAPLDASTGTVLAPVFEPGAAIPRALARNPVPLVVTARNLAAEVPDLGSQESNVLRAIGAEVLLPVRPGKDLAAFLVLGPKRSGDLYDASELDLLRVLGERAGIELRRIESAGELASERERTRELARLKRIAEDANRRRRVFSQPPATTFDSRYTRSGYSHRRSPSRCRIRALARRSRSSRLRPTRFARC